MTPPPGVEYVEIRENSEKIKGPPEVPSGPSTTLFRPLKVGSQNDHNFVKILKNQGTPYNPF